MFFLLKCIITINYLLFMSKPLHLGDNVYLLKNNRVIGQKTYRIKRFIKDKVELNTRPSIIFPRNRVRIARV
jgi:hypothetical protein